MKKLGKHKHIIQGTESFVDFISKDLRIRCAIVKRNLPFAETAMKIKYMSGAVKVTYRTKNSLEEFYIYGDKDTSKEKIEQYAKNEGIAIAAAS